MNCHFFKNKKPFQYPPTIFRKINHRVTIRLICNAISSSIECELFFDCVNIEITKVERRRSKFERRGTHPLPPFSSRGWVTKFHVRTILSPRDSRMLSAVCGCNERAENERGKSGRNEGTTPRSLYSSNVEETHRRSHDHKYRNKRNASCVCGGEGRKETKKECAPLWFLFTLRITSGRRKHGRKNVEGGMYLPSLWIMHI